ncbi:MAG: response regulator [Chloroflexi bacterium]|nr:MAG: response regulator [Chloroflexota bacterium]
MFPSQVKSTDVRVLVIDDEYLNLDLVQSLLGPTGLHVLRANGGQEGIEMASSESPNLILLDLMMRGVTGSQVVERFRALDRMRTSPPTPGA